MSSDGPPSPPPRPEGFDATVIPSDAQPLSGVRPRIVLVCGAFHRTEVSIMIGHARAEADSCGIEVAEIVWVNGAMEMPLALQRQLSREDVDCAATLGIIEAGQTQHGLAMGQAVIRSIIDLQLAFDKPIGLGIIGPGARPEHIDPRLEPHARAAVRAAANPL